jgi:hypothetical protein
MLNRLRKYVAGPDAGGAPETNKQLAEFRQLGGDVLAGVGLPLDDSGEGEEKSAQLGLVFGAKAIKRRQQVVSVEDVHGLIFKFGRDSERREREAADTGETSFERRNDLSKFGILPH